MDTMNYRQPLPQGVSLAVFQDDQCVFTSGSKWLHPLFELEQFLKQKTIDPSTLQLHDTAAGLAAAALMARMGILVVHINLISELALAEYQKFGIAVTYERKVEHLACKTEEILSLDMDIDEIYMVLRRRAKLVQGLSLGMDQVVTGYGGKQLLGPIDLKVEGGARLIIRGDNGCGKSTLLKCILGQQPLWSGSIHIGDMLASVGPTNKKPEVAPGTIAYIKQDYVKQQFPVSVREVVSMGLPSGLPQDERTWRLDISMRRTGCQDLCDRNYFTLSGGERQRVAIARCLCQNAGIFLLDEPSSFLDRESREVLVHILKGLALDEMPTIILVSHDQDFIDSLGWPVLTLGEAHV